MPPPQPERPSIRSNRTASSNFVSDTQRRDSYGNEATTYRPEINRSTTFEGPTQLHRDSSPAGGQRMQRVPSDSVAMRMQKVQLRPLTRMVSGNDGYDEPSDTSTFYSNSTSSPDRYIDRAASPATSQGSIPSRTGSSTTLNGMNTNGKKAPPPPPPSRAKKPPPPPPMKRSALSTSDVQYG
jgi:hypothetical protein